MKKCALPLIMLNVFCSLALAQYGGTPVTLKYVYKDASDFGKYAEIVVSVNAKTTLQYDGMTPYILESNARSRITMEAYGKLQTGYYARAEIQGTATGSNMPEIPPNEIVTYSSDMSAYAGYNEAYVAQEFFPFVGFVTVTMEIAARGQARHYITDWEDFDEVVEDVRYKHDPWAWGKAWATTTKIKGAKAATDDPDASEGESP